MESGRSSRPPLNRGIRLLVRFAAVLLAGALIAGAAVAGAQRPRADGGRHLLVVPHTPEGESALERSDARAIARYQSFTLVEAASDDAERLRRAGADRRDDMREVRLGERDVDPARRRSLAAKGTPRRGRAQGLALVQFVGPVKPSWLERLRATGVRVVHYAAQNGYVVHGGGQALDALAALVGTDPAVRAIVPLEAEDKAEGGDLEKPRARVAIQTLAGDDGAGPRGRVARAGRELREPESAVGLRTQLVEIDGASLRSLARDPGVIAIEPYGFPRLLDERAAQIVGGNVTGQVPSGTGYLSFLSGEGFPAATFDFVIDITDEGLDNGLVPGAHPDFFASGNAANPTRIAYQHNFTSDMNSRDCGGHGTNVASIAAGYNNGTDSTGNDAVEDASGFNYGLGIAPRAKVGASKIFRCNNQFQVSGGLAGLTSSAYASGARISSNSWGSGGVAAFGAYDSDAQLYDSLVRDAQTGIAGNQQMVEVFAAGNDGDSGYGSVTPPGTAKNVISVGASENVRPIGGSDGCAVPDSGADDAHDIIDFSSRGPTNDGRLKPDLVAPGTHVTGASPQHPGYLTDGDGTCNPQFPAGNTLYSLVSGTSQATPEVSGAAALVRDWYLREHGGGSAAPSPALTKAILVNTASDLVGGEDGKGGAMANVPNTDQGWGRVHMGRVLDSTVRAYHDQAPADLLGASGESVTRAYQVADPAKPVKVTLAFTDAPGPTTGNAFVNDLDLVVDAGGRTFKGNVFAGGLSRTGGNADPRDNVESVFLPGGTTGRISVKVVGTSVGANGVPNIGDATDQDFALVVSNVTESSAPVLSHESSSTPDDSAGGDGDGNVEPGEAFTFSETLRNAGTVAATSISATLSESMADLSITQPNSAFPTISAAATGTSSSAFGASLGSGATCGTDLQMSLALTSDQGSHLVPVTVPTGGGGPATTRTSSPGVAIPDNNSGGVGTTLSVGPAGILKDVDVRINNLSHTWVGDLVIDITSPDGTRVVLAEHPGGPDNSGNNFTNTIFDDEASANISAGAPPYTGSFKPQNDQLSRFDGKQQQGTWTLRVRDRFAGDVGTINDWGTVTRTAQCSSGDTTPPAVTLTSPADGSATNDTTSTLAGSAGNAAGDSATVTVNIWSGTGTSGSPLHTLAVTRSGGSWSTEAPTLPQGIYTARAEQSDSVPNTGFSSANTFRVDTTAPTVTLTSPANGSFTNDVTPSLSGGAGAAPGDSTSVTAKIWSGTSMAGAPLHTLVVTRSGGSWSTTAPTLAEGTYTTRAEQSDDAGNTGSGSASTFTIDTTAPDTSIGEGPAGTVNSTEAVFEFTSTEATSSFECQLDVGGFAACSSPTSYTGLSDGPHAFEVRATDPAGNTDASPATGTWTIDTSIPDTTAPAVTLALPADGSATNDTTPALAGGAGNAAGDSATVTVKIWSGTGTSGSPLHTLAATRAGGTWSADAPALAQGTYTARAEQSDSVPNTGFSSANTFTVDTAAPAVTLVDPTNGSSTNDATPALAGTAGALAGDSSLVTVKIWSGSIASGSPVHTLTTIRFGGSWSVTTPALGDGIYTARAEQSDVAANVGVSAASTFTVDTVSEPPADQPVTPLPLPPIEQLQDLTVEGAALGAPVRLRLARALRRGVPARVACGEPCTARLRLLLAARLARRLGIARSIVVGRGSARLTAPGSKRVRVRFSEKARRGLGPARSVRLALRAVITDAAGNRRTLTRRVTLRR
jgi:subtilisin-like proprotein convertase family protein